MIILFLFIYFSPLSLINTSQLTSEHCDKVSEELSAQGLTFQERFQLNIGKNNDAICIYPLYEGNTFSCCNQVTEKSLVDIATVEYNQIFLTEINTLSNTLSKMYSQILNISIQTCVEFGMKLIMITSSNMDSEDKSLVSKGIVKQIVSTLLSFLLNTSSENEVQIKVQEYLSQLLSSLTQTPCKPLSNNISTLAQRRKRRRTLQSQSNKILSRESESVTKSDITKNLDVVIKGLNTTKTFLWVYNVSWDILTHISKCQKCILPEECAINVMRMNHCSYCAGEVLSRPCFSVCLQVISGCIWKLQSLSKEWKALFEVTEKYFSKKRNLDRLFKGLGDLFESVRWNIVKRFEYHRRKSCFDSENVLPIFSEALRSEIRSLGSYVSYEARHMKVFWENLAVIMCTRSKWFSSLSNNHHCWNGSSITSPQWHKCSFCKEKKIRHNQVLKIMAHNVKTISTLLSDIKSVISSFPKHSQRNSKSSTEKVKNNKILKQSLQSADKSLKQNIPKDNKSAWKHLGKSNFIIFDDVDQPGNEEEGSGQYIISEQMKYGTQDPPSSTVKSWNSNGSSKPSSLSTLTTLIFLYLSLAVILRRL